MVFRENVYIYHRILIKSFKKKGNSTASEHIFSAEDF